MVGVITIVGWGNGGFSAGCGGFDGSGAAGGGGVTIFRIVVTLLDLLDR